MHKLTGTARHGWERMTPSMGFGNQRQQHEMPPMPNAGVRQARDPASMSRQTAPRSTISNLSFNVPFSSTLPGPEYEDIVHSTPDAKRRWTHPRDADENMPIHKLPVHAENVEDLRNLCRKLSETSNGHLQANVTSSEPKALTGLQIASSKVLITNVCLSGEKELVKRMRGEILNDTPISLRCATVDMDRNLILDLKAPGQGVRATVIEYMNHVAEWTGTDIFLLRPKQFDIETASFTGTLDNSLDQRFRLAVFGDRENSEHAKTRLLIMIDRILGRHSDVFKLELSMHTMICGRLRRHIKQIESHTNTAIYFPPPFPQIYGYCPAGAKRRRDDEILITGENMSDVYQAKVRLHELATSTPACVKEVKISPDKIDSILLERLDKIQKIIDYNGSYVLFPQLGIQHGVIRVQGPDMLHVERTIREVMSISGQFYTASWWITVSDANQRLPTSNDVKDMLADICISSGAEISFENLTFNIFGSDDAVKAALWIIDTLPFVKRAQSHLRVKIELANEHKEFVSGKKNGKINKIMSQSNVQVFFDLFNEYNFFIDVSGPSYETTKNGLELVEQEMPASIAFHVPDQYHKRIIGIGGQHIQRIMKKYSVFVKFSNAMDRGGSSKEDDDIKVDNVICRTPARNAQSLDLVKQEIMDMVEKVDAEFVSEHVIVNRLYHRELLGRMPEIEELEKKWNCKITFPSTEQASDVVTVMGPEYQVPQAVDEFLTMVPERHELSLKTTDDLSTYFTGSSFQTEVVEKLKSQYEVELHVEGLSSATAAEEAQRTGDENLTLAYTRNNAGGLRDAIDFLTSKLVAHGLDASTVKGAIPRPKSDSFEDSLPYFESKLLHRADHAAAASSSRDDVSDRSFFGKLRKPGSIGSFSSFLDRRKNGTRSPNSFMKHASSNASKASLVSLESQGSGYRNPWNDSGVDVNDDNGGWPARFSGGAPHEARSPFGHHYAGSTASLVGSSTALPPPGSSHGLSNGVSVLSPGDVTPKFDSRASHDSGRPSTSNSTNGYQPGPIGPPRT
ncbi:MAG: hypothetical protein M1828_000519 [Chrysothrix sp. TS-e1954]|nr:MAG: hypothetical protein M1828_000519 [Chrysothrix sp. TS-e1954]